MTFVSKAWSHLTWNDSTEHLAHTRPDTIKKEWIKQLIYKNNNDYHIVFKVDTSMW